MTADQANANSQRRSRLNRIRMYLLAAFVLFAFLIYGLILQAQQAELRELVAEHATYVHGMCEQRKANVLRTNANWEGLAEIERHNEFIDDKLRAERLRLYENAKLTLPQCS